MIDIIFRIIIGFFIYSFAGYFFESQEIAKAYLLTYVSISASVFCMFEIVMPKWEECKWYTQILASPLFLLTLLFLGGSVYDAIIMLQNIVTFNLL